MTRQTQGIIGVSAAQILLGTIGLCVLESGADSVSVAFYRCVIGGFVLAFYCLWRGDLNGLLRLPPKTILLALVSGFFMTGNWVLFFEGIQRTGIAVATILFHIQPFLVVILGAFFFRERLRGVTFAWIALALAGLTMTTGLTGAEFTGDTSYLIGIACTLVAAFLYSLVTLIAKSLTGITAPQLTFLQCLCGTLLLVIVVPLGPQDVSLTQWGWLAIIGIVHTGGVYVMLYNALPKLATPVIAVLLFFYPASALVVDALAYGHIMGVIQIAGLACILIASLGVTLKWGTRRKPTARDVHNQTV